MIGAAELLHALGGPAAVVDAAGVPLLGNAAFEALDAADRPMGDDDAWLWSDLPDGLRLVTAVDARVAQRGRMLATLSHEIRTPLNGVLGMAALLQATELDATQRAYLAALRDSGEHLMGLVNDVLDYARLDAGRLELERAPTDPERLLQSVCELLSPRAQAGGIEIAWAPEGEAPPRVMADDGRLRQILFNLAGNAVKLTPRGGVLLTVATSKPAPERVRLRFAVRDSGPGLEPAAQARVFEEFEQTETGQRAGGAGLGLAIVRRLVAALGGELGVESRPGEGATFWFEAEFDLAEASAEGEDDPASGLGGVCVAVASTSWVVREAASDQIAASGGRAWAPGEAPQVVLVDLAGAPAPPPPPGRRAFLLLAPEERGVIEAARAAGYEGYLIKPLRRASLVGRLTVADGGSEEVQAQGSRPAHDERADDAASRGARVLLAEDNPVNALLARALLQREGCVVDRAASGEEAIAWAARNAYDLVLMDLRMPGGDGFAATAALRAAGVTTPIVALTANAFEEDRRACLDAGMDDFLTKPIDTSALRGVLGRWAPSREVQDLRLAS